MGFVVANAAISKDEIFIGVTNLGLGSCQKGADGGQLDGDHVDGVVSSVDVVLRCVQVYRAGDD